MTNLFRNFSLQLTDIMEIQTSFLVAVVYVGFHLVFSTFSFMAIKSDRIFRDEELPRIAEWKLHTLELFGGLIGSYSAQRIHRHKIRKTMYQLRFWFIVGIHCGLIIMFFYYREMINYLLLPCMLAGQAVA